ncbi:MAG: tRNA (N6-threonylcarbamoyladenosine(37)-N6)-methyltransferase TrmO [Methanofollis sp.]|uniref:tRNA (N6-threonylcarbamoyladenosine(37)-N6)-methyltransferase TrmO n=1 Tax=Methanofollis sp. TaxID=2052835 RepID=UPI002632D10F|nr:tRNA (N6-threonylcarbamoyladenosine(37)-N6)-methyltransferase TrmO [Methanofollis sp.]MDD4255820.1 tRNA (N6-threonylcarbamoyladenosine(37)-N6)-methyltransferase TrmO [Methanofollis sp.]
MTDANVNDTDLHDLAIRYRPIGVIRSGFAEQADTPIQPVYSGSDGRVEIFPEYVEGLLDLDAFSHLILLYHFNRAGTVELRRKPFLDGSRERGIFAIRHFNRPNPIGLSIVGLTSVRGNVLEISGVDILDNTPLLDIKPYIYQFDHRENVRSGWVDLQTDGRTPEKCTPAELSGQGYLSREPSP